jgi:ribosomal protein S18 acetylase RimI-like enzyme
MPRKPNPAAIRTATAADIPALIALACESPTAAHWTEQQYDRLLHPHDGGVQSLVLVAQEDSPDLISPPPPRLLGFLVGRHIPPEWELENIVVVSTARRGGIGTLLLDALLLRARETNSDSVFLEVRDSNLAARTLYEKAGFELPGRRKSYYKLPEEDAVLYRKRLP